MKRAVAKALKWTGVGLASALGLVLLALCATLVVAATPWGSDRLRGPVLSLVNRSIEGNLEYRALRLVGSRVILEGMVLRDPEGEVVATLERLEVKAQLLALLRKEARLAEVKMLAPELWLKQDARGLNLLRAIASRQPKPEGPEPPPSEPPSLTASVGSLHLERGKVEYLQESSGGEGQAAGKPLVVRMEALGIDGSARYGLASEEVEADLRIGAQTLTPIKGPLALTLTAQGDAAKTAARLALDLTGLALRLNATREGRDTLAAQLEKLEVKPSVIRAFAPGAKVDLPLAATGTAKLAGHQAEADLRASAGSARLSLQGAVDLEQLTARGVKLRLSHVNFRELVRGAPKSDVALHLDLDGGGKSLERLELAAHLKVPPSKVEGHPFGPVEFRALADHGQFRIADLLALLPGLNLRGAGTGSEKDLSFAGRLEVVDLETFGSTLGRIATGKPLPLDGKGVLDFSAKGPVKHPGVAFKGAFPKLAFATHRASGLELSGSVPDVQRPLDTQAAISVTELRLGDRAFQDLILTLATRGRELALDLRTKVPTLLQLAARAVADTDHQGLDLQSMTLEYPEAKWALKVPSHIRFPTGNLSVAPLTLTSGAQSISLGARLKGTEVDADAAVQSLSLSTLPKAFVPPELGLAGELGLRAKVSGTTDKPDVQAEASLAGGSFRQLKGLNLALKAIYKAERAVGDLKLDATQPRTGLQANFDLPVQAMLRRRNEPVSLHAELREVSLESLGQATGSGLPVTGWVKLNLDVTGTGSNPKLALEVGARELRTASDTAKALPAASMTLKAFSDDSREDRLTARLVARSGSGGGPLTVKAPWTLSKLISDTPSPNEFQTATLAVTSDIEGLSVAPLAGASDGKGLEGSISLKGEAGGSLKAPTADLVFSARGIKRGELPPIDLTATLDATSRNVRLNAKALQGPNSLLQAQVGVEAPVARLSDRAVLESTPLSIDATFGPVAASNLRALAGMAEPPPGQRLSAVVQARVEAQGTLRDPKLSLTTDVDKMGLGETGLGKIHLAYGYQDRSSNLEAKLQSPGGALSLKAHTELDLSLPALSKGLAYRNAPVQAHLAGQDFDVSMFNGLAEMVRQVGGKLSADAKLSGTIGSPAFRGSLKLWGGQLALMGFGSFKELNLDLQGANDFVELKELSAKSGRGSAELSARADRNGDRFLLKGKGQLKKFPIIAEDQLVATASLKLSMEGQASDTLVNVSKLAIPDATFELPNVKRRDLQDLSRPDDIVLMRNGRVIDSKQRKALALAEEQAKAKKAKGVGGSGVVTAKQLAAAEKEQAQEPLRRYTVRIDAPRNLWVKGDDVNAEVGFSDGFRIEYANDLAMFGEVRVMRGRVDVLGRRFDVQRDSTVRFMGPPIKPYISATAIHNNESEGVKVYMNVRGQGTDLTLRPTSEPPLSESEIYTLIATGRRSLRRGSGASTSGSAQAASIVGSVVASQTKQLLKGKLPLDVISIEAGDQGLQDAKLEAGTYLTDKFYVGYTGTPFGPSVNPRQNTNAVRLEYQLSPRWNVDLEYGDAPAGGLDLLWGKDY